MDVLVVLSVLRGQLVCSQCLEGPACCSDGATAG